jgi:hypothetical protein
MRQGLELKILLLPSPRSWDYKFALPHLAKSIFKIRSYLIIAQCIRSARAAIRKHHRLSDLSNRILSSHRSGG